MEENKLFTPSDCQQTGYDLSIFGKVVILCVSSLPENKRSADHQLYFCTGGFGSKPNPSGRAVFAVSLDSGEQARWNRSDIMGIAKPEILTDRARLQLSQIRPSGALDLNSNEPQYSGGMRMKSWTPMNSGRSNETCIQSISEKRHYSYMTN